MSATESAPSAGLQGALCLLLQRGRLPRVDLPLSEDDALGLGLVADDEDYVLPAGWDPLAGPDIVAALAQRARSWLARLDVLPVIDSTNLELSRRATTGRIAGHVCLAELQLAGRGRRGRHWQSPLGGNLALSLGIDALRPASELGSLSLVVGLAALDALSSIGITGLVLKWPNDLLLGNAKVCGILIERVDGRAGPELIVGVGLNLRVVPAVRARIEQPIADLSGAMSSLPGRSALAGQILSSIVDYSEEFRQSGFAPFREVFDHHHAFHGKEVDVIQGDRRRTVTAIGVASDGGLRVKGQSGEEILYGGEVSLRSADRSQS